MPVLNTRNDLATNAGCWQNKLSVGNSNKRTITAA